ncbi:cytochrome P450 [Actinomadura vinacea]|uniref:Cytochrome P450 n=1 Tax=Actinomadura vinacea TaxID=115336 RepID=A0ABN3JH93_9ACTN
MTVTEEANAINLLSAAAWADGQPLDQFRWLRENHPVYWHPQPEPSRDPRYGTGFWAVTSYEGVHTVLRHNDLYSSHGYLGMLDLPEEVKHNSSFIMLDDPRHALLRKIISGWFTPRVVKRREARFREIAGDIIDEMSERGACEFVQDVAGKMASYVGADLLGIPRSDAVALYRYVETIHGVSDTQDPKAVRAARKAEDEYCRQVWREKRANPADDISTRLAFGMIGDEPMDEEAFVPNLGLLVHGSSDTTRNLIAGGILALLQNPDQRTLLMEDLDGGIGTAVEEMLRWLSPVAHVYRIATRDTVLLGRRIKRGDAVIPWYGAANFDPAKFETPERFDVRRSPNPHIAFGFSGHYCLGVHVGRLQGRVMMGEVLRRIPDLELAEPVSWLASTLVSGPATMRVRYSPAK